MRGGKRRSSLSGDRERAWKTRHVCSLKKAHKKENRAKLKRPRLEHGTEKVRTGKLVIQEFVAAQKGPSREKTTTLEERSRGGHTGQGNEFLFEGQSVMEDWNHAERTREKKKSMIRKRGILEKRGWVQSRVFPSGGRVRTCKLTVRKKERKGVLSQTGPSTRFTKSESEGRGIRREKTLNEEEAATDPAEEKGL